MGVQRDARPEGVDDELEDALGKASMDDRASVDLLRGSLDLLILAILAEEELHGWGVSRRIRDLSQAVLEVNQGSLYPALYRLEDQGLIRSRWGVSREGRRAKLYRLTAAGTGKLRSESRNWRLFSGAVDQILAVAGLAT